MSYYGYERLRPGDALGIDMSLVTEQFGKDLNAYKKKKEDEVVDVAEANRDFAQNLVKMPSSFNGKWNTFFGDMSTDISQAALKTKEAFDNNEIDKKTHDIRMANLNSSTGMTVESMTKVASRVDEIEKKAAAGDLNAIEEYKYNRALEMADLSNVSLIIDPQSNQFTFVKVKPGDIKTGKSSSYELLNQNLFYNYVNVPITPKYDTNAAITNTLNTLGGVQDITTSEGKREAGKILSGTKGDEIVSNLAQAMLGQTRDLIEFGMKNIIMNKTEEGLDSAEQVNFDIEPLPMNVYEDGGSINQEELKKLQTDNPYIFYEDQSGRFYESDKGKEVILKNAEQMLRGAADYTLVEPKPAKVISQEPSVDQLLSTVRAITGTGAKPPAALIELVLDEAGLSQEEINKFKTDYNAEGTSDTSQIITDAYSWLKSNLRDKSFGENVDKTVEGIQPVLFAFGYDVVKKDDGSIDVLDGEDLIYNIKENDDKAFINLYNKIAGQQKRTGITLAYSSAKLANPSIAKKKLPGQ